ncbi:hypothetical protein ACFLSV_08440 [Bacteroidota bacterium]
MKLSTIFFLLNILITSCTVSQEKSVLPIDASRNVTLLTVKIGDVEIPNILLDTGMPFDGIMIYNPDYKDSLDLTNAIEVKIGGAGDGDDSKALLIDSTEFVLGDIEMTNQRIIMLMGDLYKGFPSNGIIGYSVFGHYITEFDYDNNTMTLHNTDEIKVDSTWTEIPLYFKDNNIPWIDASVVIKNEEPIPLSMYIDYASRDAIELLERPGMKFTLPEETEESYLGRGLSGDIYGKNGFISKLIIGPYELTNVKTAFAPAEVRSKQDNADGILGNGTFKRFNLIFDYENKKLYLKPNTFFNEPF